MLLEQFIGVAPGTAGGSPNKKWHNGVQTLIGSKGCKGDKLLR